jgi:hypothetical protein
MSAGVNSRFTRPVFVVGSPRSGTTLLYHMLLSTGEYAIYRAETLVYSKLGPRFDNFRDRRQREQFMDLWLKSDLFSLAGVERESIRTRVVEECGSSGDFLRILMETIAARQNVPRWAENTPTHIHYMQQIKRDIPDALFVHMIRDGRDAALSIERQGWVYPFPWDRDKRIQVASIFWEWTVNRGRKEGRKLGCDYAEVHFEELVSRPRETLERIGEFIGQKLDYDQILKAGVGSVRHPNTAFGAGAIAGESRWKKMLGGRVRDEVEMLIGRTLGELGYEAPENLVPGLRLRFLRWMYTNYFSCRHWLKSETFLGRRFVTLEVLQPGYIVHHHGSLRWPGAER